MSKVLNKYKDKIPTGAVNIMRPGKWGNPFVMKLPRTDESRHDVVVRHKYWFLANPQMMEEAKKELRGKDLVCCCAPKECHGEILLEVANG